jgi:hypothetical protein
VATEPTLDVRHKQRVFDLLCEVDGLVELHLGGQAVDDEWMRNVAALDSVHTLWLNDTAISSIGLRHVSTMPALRCVTLVKMAVDHDGLRNLSHCTTLKYLSFEGVAGITSEGIAELARLPRLEELRLPRVDDEIVPSVLSLKNLRALHADSFWLSSATLTRLKQSSLDVTGLPTWRLDDDDPFAIDPFGDH